VVKTPWYQWGIDSARKRLVLALLVAAAFSDLLSIQPYRRAWRAMKAIFGLLAKNDPRVDAERLQRRLDACERCPYFYRPLATCGSPLRSELRHVGCRCNIEAKAKLAEADCYIDETSDLAADDGFGWAAAERRYWINSGDALSR
jgi:hypothetical protein